jgi:hypothetical protein
MLEPSTITTSRSSTAVRGRSRPWVLPMARFRRGDGTDGNLRIARWGLLGLHDRRSVRLDNVGPAPDRPTRRKLVRQDGCLPAKRPAGLPRQVVKAAPDWSSPQRARHRAKSVSLGWRTIRHAALRSGQVLGSSCRGSRFSRFGPAWTGLCAGQSLVCATEACSWAAGSAMAFWVAVFASRLADHRVGRDGTNSL